MFLKKLVVKVWKYITMLQNKTLLGLLPTLIFVLAAMTTGLAQSTTTDTLGRGEVYIEGNFWTATQSHRNGGSQVYGGRVGIGVGKQVEVGINASFSDPHDTDFPPEIQPDVKWKLYEHKKRGIAVAVGATAFLPVARLRGTDAFVMIYGNASKTFAPLKGARITAGGYILLARNSNFGSRQGLNFSYDQPLTEKSSFSIQWTTGRNRFGYLTPGMNIMLTKKSNVFIGYSVGNHLYDNHGPYMAYSYYR